jgi:hypothetical protein
MAVNRHRASRRRQDAVEAASDGAFGYARVEPVALRAKHASLCNRPGLPQETISCAAQTGPTPGSASSCGASTASSLSSSSSAAVKVMQLDGVGLKDSDRADLVVVDAQDVQSDQAPAGGLAVCRGERKVASS